MREAANDRQSGPVTKFVADSDLHRLDAAELADGIRNRRFSASAVMEACLARIAQRDPVLHAFAFVDPDLAMERAHLADEWQRQGLPLGALHGVPVGVKDVFDTCDMPAEYGSHLYKGRRPKQDGAVVSVLRNAGAIIVGKTTTSEFGMYHQSAARNPQDVLRSAGVSSSGSAVAVADEMIPIAIGTQHTASTLLPASFCGAVGFKPSFGFTDMTGSNILVPRLAQLGLLSRNVGDLKLLMDVFSGHVARPLVARQPFRIGVVRGPYWSNVDPGVDAIFEEWASHVNASIVETRLPDIFTQTLDTVTTLLDAHLAFRFGELDEASFSAFCKPLQDCITRGKQIGAVGLIAANTHADAIRRCAEEIFAELDVLLTLAAPTEANLIEESPGSGVLTMPWSLCGLPTISLPILRGPSGLPIGVQLIAGPGQDLRLLQAAAWLEAQGPDR